MWGGDLRNIWGRANPIRGGGETIFKCTFFTLMFEHKGIKYNYQAKHEKGYRHNFFFFQLFLRQRKPCPWLPWNFDKGESERETAIVADLDPGILVGAGSGSWKSSDLSPVFVGSITWFFCCFPGERSRIRSISTRIRLISTRIRLISTRIRLISTLIRSISTRIRLISTRIRSISTRIRNSTEWIRFRRWPKNSKMVHEICIKLVWSKISDIFTGILCLDFNGAYFSRSDILLRFWYLQGICFNFRYSKTAIFS